MVVCAPNTTMYSQVQCTNLASRESPHQQTALDAVRQTISSAAAQIKGALVEELYSIRHLYLSNCHCFVCFRHACNGSRALLSLDNQV